MRFISLYCMALLLLLRSEVLIKSTSCDFLFKLLTILLVLEYEIVFGISLFQTFAYKILSDEENKYLDNFAFWLCIHHVSTVYHLKLLCYLWKKWIVYYEYCVYLSRCPTSNWNTYIKSPYLIYIEEKSHYLRHRYPSLLFSFGYRY